MGRRLFLAIGCVAIGCVAIGRGLGSARGECPASTKISNDYDDDWQSVMHFTGLLGIEAGEGMEPIQRS